MRYVLLSLFSGVIASGNPTELWATGTDDVPGATTVIHFEKSMIETELLRTPPNSFKRSTFYLYIKPRSADLLVTARCYLWKEGQSVGRFPLQRVDNERGRVPSDKDRGRLLFRVECLADEFVGESAIHLRVIDERKGEMLPGVKISLKDAVPWRSR